MMLPGLNVQWPWSAWLVAGDKTVETRGYPMPSKYIGQELAIIETPGPRGRREAGIERARVTGVVVFDASFLYGDEAAWRADMARHRVPTDSPFGFGARREVWGWPVRRVRALACFKEAPRKRGIVFCSACDVGDGT